MTSPGFLHYRLEDSGDTNTVELPASRAPIMIDAKLVSDWSEFGDFKKNQVETGRVDETVTVAYRRWHFAHDRTVKALKQIDVYDPEGERESSKRPVQMNRLRREAAGSGGRVHFVSLRPAGIPANTRLRSPSVTTLLKRFPTCYHTSFNSKRPESERHSLRNHRREYHNYAESLGKDHCGRWCLPPQQQ